MPLHPVIRSLSGSKASAWCGSFACLLFLLLLPIAEACADELDDLFSLPLEQLLSLRVTTSTQQEETLSSVPSAMTVIDRDEIRKLGVTTLAELLNLVPGYQSYRTDQSSLGEVISSRGRRVGTSGREILVMLDGVRLNNDWNGGALGPISRIRLDNVERVEVIRGPGSTIYGSNAFLGVINIITRAANSVTLEAGSHGYGAGVFQGRWQRGETWGSAYVAAEMDKGEALVIYDPDPSVKANVVSRDPYETQTLYFQAGHQGVQLRGFLHQSLREEYYLEGKVNEDVNQLETMVAQLNLQYQKRLGRYWQGQLQWHARKDEQGLRQYLIKPLVQGDATLRQQEQGIEARLAYDDQVRHKFLLGLEYRRPEVVEAGFCTFPFVVTCIAVAPESARQIQGVYGQYQYRLNEHWEGILGLREDRYSNFGNHLSPRAGILYHRDDRNTFKLLYGEAFRAPSRIETDILNNQLFLGNPNLKPEIARSNEFIWLRLMNRGYLQWTLFTEEIADGIEEAVGPAPRFRVNTGKQKISGHEVEYRLQFSRNWTSRVALTYFDEQALDKNAESRWLFGGNLSYEKANWVISLGSNYQSDKYDSYDPALGPPGYRRYGGKTLWSLSGRYEWGELLTFTASIHNLTDKEYRTPAENSANHQGVANRGRTFQLGLEWQW